MLFFTKRFSVSNLIGRLSYLARFYEHNTKILLNLKGTRSKTYKTVDIIKIDELFLLNQEFL